MIAGGREPTDWFAVAVTPGAEIALGRALGAAGFAVLPMVKRLRVRRSRQARATVEVERPVLAGYLVVEMRPGADWRGLMRFRQVRGVVGIGGEPWPIRARELASLRRLTAASGLVSWAPMPGEAVEIVGGWHDGARVITLSVEAGPAGARARVLLRLLGVDSEQTVPVDRLAPADEGLARTAVRA